MALSIVPRELLRATPVPRPDAIDVGWLDATLRRAGHAYDIAGFDIAPIGTGQIGETARITLRYDPAGRKGPPTLVGKFASRDATSLKVAEAWQLYEREVRFYHKLAAHAGVATPAYYGAEMDASGAFVLLLQDLAPATPGDQFAGLEREQALAAVREAARLHASFWNRGEDPKLAWLDSGPLAQPFYAPEVFRETWPAFRERYGAQLSDDQRRVCDALAEGYNAYSRPRARPRCVTHNDFRPDNMLFAPGRLTVVDWQSVALGSAAVDVAYLIGGAYAPDQRREAEPVLIAAYLEELRRRGVTDYSDDEFAADFRHFTFAGINVAVGAAMLVQRTERGDRMFLTMLDRHVSHVLDHDALHLLRETV